ncbi:NVEALA domain-containing protein [uncultured Rikenella sp.]|uniref:NVEALA domain-containing protein n=1 Tax=uncultured Rikenella sp. TaxID=368003 RepID=UPI0026043A34|nr:NVEALA domain-containing protein [uncultured Rikenella sp.]
MFVGAVAIALAGGAYLNSQQVQRSETVSDLMLANIEAMADGEVEAGYVNTKTTTESYGEYSNAGGGVLCRPHVIETTCWGNGTEWCTHTASLSQDCFTPNNSL